MSYSVGFTLPETTAELLKLIPASAWTPAYESDGKARDVAVWDRPSRARRVGAMPD
jgi:hypothetical protein